MKMFINSIIGILGIFLLAACSTTGSMMSGSSDYGYYDNMYYHSSPSYYGANPYLYPRTRIIHNNVIVLPENKKIEKREQVRRRPNVSPKSRRTVTPSEPNRTINRRQNIPSRGGNSVAPSSRRSAPADTRGASGSRTRGRGN